MNFKGKDCVSHAPKRLAGMDERVSNSCKRGAEYLRRSLVIVHTQCSQWQAAFIREKSQGGVTSIDSIVTAATALSQRSTVKSTE